MIEAIKKRRSIRCYQNKPVEPEKINELLQAAMLAPSAMNLMPWHFTVVTNREKLTQIPTYHPYTNMMKTAPCAIIVSGDRAITKKDAFIYCDCSAAIMNILLSAVDLDLGTCWCAIAPDESRISAFRSAFDLPEAWLPVAIVAVGYAAEQKGMKDTFKPERITYYE